MDDSESFQRISCLFIRGDHLRADFFCSSSEAKISGPNSKIADTGSWDPWTVEIKVEDNDLSNVRNISELKNPEFLHGNIKKEKTQEVTAAIESARESKEMCEILCMAARRRKQKLDAINDIKPSIKKEIEVAFDWLMKKIDSAQSTTLSKNEVKAETTEIQSGEIPHVRKEAETKSNHLCRWLCCIRAPEQTQEKPGHFFVIYIKLLSGSLLTVNQQVEGTVNDLKKNIHKIKRISPQAQTLFLNGKQLEDKTPLQSIEGLPNSTVTLIQRRCILGIPQDVAVHLRLEKSANSLSFSIKRFPCLYKWYPEGQQMPDVYRGEFFCGICAHFNCGSFF
jgi:hypothetical protein